MASERDHPQIRIQRLESKDANGQPTWIDATLILPPPGVELRGGVLALDGLDRSPTGLARHLTFLADAANGYAVLAYDAESLNHTFTQASNTAQYQPDHVEVISKRLTALANAHPNDPGVLLRSVKVAASGSSADLKDAATALAAAADKPQRARDLAGHMAELVSRETVRVLEGVPREGEHEDTSEARAISLDDARVGYDFLRRVLEDRALPIHGVGQRVGASLMCALSSERKFKSLVLLRPNECFADGSLPHLKDAHRSSRWWPVDNDGTSLIRNGLKRFGGFVTIVRSDTDGAAAIEATKHFMKAARHAQLYELPGAAQNVEPHQQNALLQIMISVHFAEADGRMPEPTRLYEVDWTPKPVASHTANIYR